MVLIHYLYINILVVHCGSCCKFSASYPVVNKDGGNSLKAWQHDNSSRNSIFSSTKQPLPDFVFVNVTKHALLRMIFRHFFFVLYVCIISVLVPEAITLPPWSCLEFFSRPKCCPKLKKTADLLNFFNLFTLDLEYLFFSILILNPISTRCYEEVFIKCLSLCLVS